MVRAILHLFNYPISSTENWAKAHRKRNPFISPGLKARANERINMVEGFSPKLDYAELAYSVQYPCSNLPTRFTLQVSPADISRQFAQWREFLYRIICRKNWRVSENGQQSGIAVANGGGGIG